MVQKIMFSLVIPLGETRGANVLKSIEKLEYNKRKFEVIVERGPNPSKNRNKGIKKSKGDFIIFLNGHSFLEKAYLKKTEKFFKKYSHADIVGGSQLSPKTENLFEKFSEAVVTSNFAAFKVNKRYKIQKNVITDADETFLTSANLCVKKKVFEKISGFDERLWPGEDPEFIFRAKKNNFKVFYNPEMIIFNKRRPTFSLFCKQFFNYGYTRPKKNKISKDFKLVFFIPLLFSLYFMFLPLISLVNFLFIVPFIIYVGLSILFGLIDSIRQKIFLGIFVLPFLFLFLHLSYGIGMIAGYFNR